MTLLQSLALLAAGGFLAYFGERFGAAVLDGVTNLKTARRDFADHFRGLRSGETDLLVFTLTARPHLPITDVLYFELIHHLLRTGRARSVLMNIWWPTTALNQQSEGLSRRPPASAYTRYVQRFETLWGDRVEILHEYSDGSRKGSTQLRGLKGGVVDGGAHAKASRGAGLDGNSEIPDIFWSSLRKLTSKDYYTWVRNLGVPARRLRDLNRARPDNNQILEGLFAHTIYNSRLAPLVMDRLRRVGSGGDAEVVLSILFWELEVDRLVVFYELYDEQKRSQHALPFVLNPIAGRTIRASRRRASDNHSPEKAVSLATSPVQQLEKIARLTRNEVRAYVAVLDTILAVNYEYEVDRAKWAKEAGRRIVEWRVAEKVGRIPRLSKRELELVFLLDELRRQWVNH